MQANQVTPCALCGKGLCAEGAITFYRVRVERYIVDTKAVNERIGLQAIFGGRASPQLIEALAPSTDVAVLIHEPASVLVCESCAVVEQTCVARLNEHARELLDKQKRAALAADEVNDEDQDRRRSDRQVAQDDRH